MSPLRRSGLVATIALLVVACGAQTVTPVPPPAPTRTAQPTPTATPTPVDVGALVLEAIKATGYSAHFTLQGTGTFGDQTLTTTGTWDTAGGDSHSSTHVVMGTQDWTTDNVEVGGKSWDSSAGGPYIPSANTACNSVSDALRLAKALTDEGTTTKNGQKLHHLTIQGGVDASCMAPTSISVTDMKLTLDLYATDDGKLASISETDTWTQLSGGSPLSASLTSEATVTSDPAGAITAPTAPWSVYEDADGHFRVAYPAGWTEDLSSGRPTLHDADRNYVIQIMVSKLPAGYTLSQYAKADRDSLNSLKSLTVDATQAADLGGEAGGLLEFHYVSGTTPLHALDVYTVHAGNSCDVFWESVPGTEKADFQLFSNIVNSFEFTQ
jgi:hypothetical protein